MYSFFRLLKRCFHDPTQQLRVNVSHCRPNAMAEIPCRLVGNVNRALDLQRRHSLLRFGHKVNGKKPFRQGKMGIVKDRAARYGELITAGIAIVLAAICDCRDTMRLTARTFNAFRPAKSHKALPSLLIASEKGDQFRKIHFGFEGFGRFFHSYA